MTPSERIRPFPGAWPLRPCSLRRTPSRVRKPGPSPLRSLYSVRSIRTSQPVRGSACSVRRQPVLFIAACSSGAHCHLSLLSPALLPSMPSVCPPCPGPVPPGRDDPRYPAIMPVPSGPGKRSARGNARRRNARSRHSWLGCRYAPRPACRADGSGTTSFPACTTRSKSDLAARAPHPTHIRIAGSDRTGRGNRLAILLLSLPCRCAGGTGHRAWPGGRLGCARGGCLARAASGGRRRACGIPGRRRRGIPGRRRRGIPRRRRTGIPRRRRPGIRHRSRRALVWPDVDPPAGQPGRQPRVLAFFADRQRELVIGHDHLGDPRLQVDDVNPGNPGGRQCVRDELSRNPGSNRRCRSSRHAAPSSRYGPGYPSGRCRRPWHSRPAGAR